ncbi:uncharacterized protein LOC131226685 isoform X2 [Magnolia sinica]|uniref:uncharacterized protein LOC131226685 isoform X2 n=1 Tax=Magnolia sinica TaxID=86752 RepID=UPI0026594D81|nr:uncharacterized protein LOC131226685 isoform X2 [Magnolia sinica]
MTEGDHPRLILPSFLSSSLCKVLPPSLPLSKSSKIASHPPFLSSSLCKELEFIHKSSSTVGYRPSVFSTTLSHLIATNSPHLLLPFLPIRERLKERVEEFFGCDYELFVEFTGLISWCRGASIGWHSDDNRPYLKQRSFAAVCYLNSHGMDFKGGLFHFHDGDPATIVPMAGITDGERLTLTLWFTLDPSHDEDPKLISLLSQRLLSHDRPDSYLPSPASSNMYWFSSDSASDHQLGFDIRWARVCALGYNFYTSDDRIDSSISGSSFDPLELLNGPLQLAREDEIFEKEFVNSLHALQVVQFYYWRASELQEMKGRRETNDAVKLIQPSSRKGFMSTGNYQLAEMIIGHSSCNDDKRPTFDWVDFAAAIAIWEDYVHRLCRELMISIPYWKTHQSIFTVSPDGV